MRFLVAVVVLCAATAAQARPSPYPAVTQFAGDRYAAQAQMGADVAKTVQRQRAAKKLNRRATGAHRKRWRGPVPLPAPNPNRAEPGAVEQLQREDGAAPVPLATGAWDAPAPRLSAAGGAWREAGRAVGPRPRAWCGWWLGRHLGMPHRELWLARNWARVGSSAGGPRVGAVVVWPHHVGIITGRQNGLWVVKSGNDRNAVRERPRSVAGAIAFRLPSS